MSEDFSSIWRTAYIGAIFETDAVKLALRIADADAAIKERLNSSVEISGHERESIEAAQQKLATLKRQQVDSVFVAGRTTASGQGT